MKLPKLNAALFLLIAWACQAGASACSVCATGKDAARPFYYASTAFLSLAPIAMVGGIVYYLVKKRG